MLTLVTIDGRREVHRSGTRLPLVSEGANGLWLVWDVVLTRAEAGELARYLECYAQTGSLERKAVPGDR